MIHSRDCFTSHLGLWMCDASWLRSMVGGIKSGLIQAVRVTEEGPPPEQYSIAPGGVAIVSLSGPMLKGGSKFGGVSTVMTRQAIGRASRDPRVSAILLVIDSPGGSVAGTADLAEDVALAGSKKPVFAHVDDQACSAAYWVAAQARLITASATSLIGSIGTMALIEDSSKAFEMEGIKVHAISSGGIKGQGFDGVPVSPAYLREIQQIINDLNAHFVAGVAKGRGMSIAQAQSLATGESWIAARAQQRGLVDTVQSLNDTIEGVQALVGSNRNGRRHASTTLASVKIELAQRGPNALSMAWRRESADRMKRLEQRLGKAFN